MSKDESVLAELKDAVGILKDRIVPWRERHAQSLAQLKLDEERFQAELAKAKETGAVRGNWRDSAVAVEMEGSGIRESAIIKRAWADAEQIKLEYEKHRRELDESRVQLAMKILSELAADLSEEERLAYLPRLLPALNILTDSNLDIEGLLKPSGATDSDNKPEKD